MTNDITFILSDARSGSTLLDQLLGANKDVVTIGEVHWLAAYVNQDRRIYNPVHPLNCSCGQTISECVFWLRVEEAVGHSLGTLVLRPRIIDKARSGELPWKLVARVGRRMKSIVDANPAYYRNSVCQRILDGQRIAADSIRLFDAIKSVSGARCIIDSSKATFRFRSVFEAIPDRVLVILLARDYRAVVHSKMNRGKTMETAAIGWKRKALQMEELTKDVPQDKVYRLKYEELCREPKIQVRKLCEFLDLEFSHEMLIRPSVGIHHLGGSPSKFDKSRSKIKLDQRYLEAFSNSELQHMERIVGDSARIWGY